jgi:uncharacterized protein YggU (UPF0235/DUF167 family)
MYVKARVIAGAKREAVVRRSADHFDVSVKEPAERNLANRRVIEIIAREFGVEPGKVRIVSGHQSPSKILSVRIEEIEN